MCFSQSRHKMSLFVCLGCESVDHRGGRRHARDCPLTCEDQREPPDMHHLCITPRAEKKKKRHFVHFVSLGDTHLANISFRSPGNHFTRPSNFIIFFSSNTKPSLVILALDFPLRSSAKLLHNQNKNQTQFLYTISIKERQAKFNFES